MQTSGTFGRHWGHMADICQTLGRCWANVGQLVGRHWADVGGQTVSSINPSPILKQLHLSIRYTIWEVCRVEYVCDIFGHLVY